MEQPGYRITRVGIVFERHLNEAEYMALGERVAGQPSPSRGACSMRVALIAASAVVLVISTVASQDVAFEVASGAARHAGRPRAAGGTDRPPEVSARARS